MFIHGVTPATTQTCRGSAVIQLVTAVLLTWGAVAPGWTADTSNATPATAATVVQVLPLQAVQQFPERTAPAQVVARNESRLSAEVGGTLVEWRADVGARVAAGDVLARIDATDLQLSLDRARAARDAAQARLALGEAQLRRARELVGQGFFSQEALAQRETEVALQRADLASAEAQRRSAERQLAKAVIRAPFAGTVMQRLAQRGEVVAAGAPLFVLAQTGGAEVQATVSPSDLPDLRTSRALQFEPSVGAPVPARLLRVVEAVSPGSRLQTVRLGLPDGRSVAPGTEGVLRWRAAQPHVPTTVVVRRGAALGVFVADGEDPTLRARFVPLPQAQEGRVAAVDLPPTARIVVNGQAALRDGQPIRVEDAARVAPTTR